MILLTIAHSARPVHAQTHQDGGCITILGSGRRKPFLFFTFFQPCLIMMSYQKQVAYKAVKGSSGRLGRSTWRQYDDDHPPMHLNRQTFIMIELGIIIKVFFLAAQDAQSSRGRRPATHPGQAGRTPVCRFAPPHPPFVLQGVRWLCRVLAALDPRRGNAGAGRLHRPRSGAPANSLLPQDRQTVQGGPLLLRERETVWRFPLRRAKPARPVAAWAGSSVHGLVRNPSGNFEERC